MNTRLQNRFTRVDVVAIAAFAAVWIYFAIMVSRGFFLADEGLYLTMIERFAIGDRPLVDEWHLSQMAFIPLCVPYKLYVALTGGTDGIALFMRYLFLVVNAAFYWFMYIRLRAYRWSAVVATLLFCIYVPSVIYFCNYYTMPCRLLMIVCLILFFGRQKPLSLLSAGVLLSCAVLCQPGLALLYLGYSVLVLARFLCEKKGNRILEDYDFCLQIRVWKYISLAVLVCAVVFLSLLLWQSGLRNILKNLPYILVSDPEYDYFAHGNAGRLFIRKFSEVVNIYGWICLIPAVLILVLSVAYARKRIRVHRRGLRRVLFCSACVIWALSCIYPFRNTLEEVPDPFVFMYYSSFFWFGFVCFLLCEHKKSRRLLFFWVVGLVSSLCIDLCSDVALSAGYPIAYIADLLFCIELVRELRADHPKKRITNNIQLRSQKKEKRIGFLVRCIWRTACFGFAVWFVFVLFFLENASLLSDKPEVASPSSLTFLCEKGPCRSLRFVDSYGQSHADKLSDVDTLKKSHPKNLLIFGMAPELYLYAGLPYSTCTSYTWENSAYLDWHVQYWKLHPDRLPECIYIPIDHLYNNNIGTLAEASSWVREAFEPLCTFTMEAGKSGYILYVSHWNPDVTATAQ